MHLASLVALAFLSCALSDQDHAGPPLSPGKNISQIDGEFEGRVEKATLDEAENLPRNKTEGGGAAANDRRPRNSSLEATGSEEEDPRSPIEESEEETDDWEPGEEEEALTEVAKFGLRAMHELYHVKEPKLYAMGLYLENDNPARYVAAFNDQTEEARILAKYGFAVLQSTAMLMQKFPDARREQILSRRNRENPLQRQCPSRGTPDCPPASVRYRTSDGSCNNLENLWWGSAMSPMQRFLPAVYQDGVQTIRRSRSGRPLPSAREVSNILHEDRDVPLASVTHMLMQWGQFVDHDLTATGQSRGFNGTVPQCCLGGGTGFQPPEFMHPECQPIPVNLQDSFYGRLGVRCLEFLRSGAAPSEGCEFGPREQLSQVTSYLDASTVYSSNAFQADTLRLFRNGLLQYGRIQSRRPLLPRQDSSDLCKLGSLSTSCFRAGDGRLSEQPALTSLHVVFLRLHNRVATKLAALNFHWSDEKLFQESRRIVGAIVQHITYREFLPIVLGQEVMKIFDLEVLRKGYYEGYDPEVNPTIANGFSTAAYRFGHSLVQHSFVRFDSHHKPLFNNVSIHDEFSNPANLESPGSVDRLLLGLVNQPSQKRDELITSELTNHLFQTPRFPFGMDLASLNIQRGRDHGIPPYVAWREPCGLSPIRTFEDLHRAMPEEPARKLKLLYESVEDIDLFPAGLAENSVPGGLVGPTFACIIAQQFGNLRRGDRFWYENPDRESSFTPGQLQQIRRVTLAQVLCKTMDNIETIQPFVFLVADGIRNRRVACEDPGIGELNLEAWAERPAELRNRADHPEKSYRRPRPSEVKVESGPSKEQTKVYGRREKPVKSSIHQHNKIVVRRPLGPPDNVTIVVQNNAVNAPVFVNDAIYGSHLTLPTGQRPIEQGTGNNRPGFGYTGKPIPVFHGSNTRHPYVPMGFNDPSNPNPLNYGYQTPTDVLFESFPPTSPPPTLYTYYTNVLQRPTTERPQEIDGYLVNYGPQTSPKPRPTPMPGSWSSLESSFEPNQQSYRPLPVPGSQNSQPIRPVEWQEQPYRPVGQQQQQLEDGWPSSGYQAVPTKRPGQQSDGDWSTYQGSKVTQDDPYRDGPRPRPQGFHQLNRPVGLHQESSLPRPIHRPSKRPIQADPDGWSTLPVNHKGSSGYQVTGNQVKPTGPFLHNDRPADPGAGAVVVIGQNTEPERYGQSSAYQREPVRDFASRPIGPNTETGLEGTKNPVGNRRPVNQFTQGDDRPGYRPDVLKNTGSSYNQQQKQPPASFQNENGLPVQSNYPGRPITVENFDPRNGSNQFYKNPSSARPKPDSPSYQVRTEAPERASASTQTTETNAKPSKTYSVTILTETSVTTGVNSETRDDVTSETRHEVTSEVPRPLVPRPNDQKKLMRPGQYYYEKNVLHRYPEVVEQVPGYRRSTVEDLRMENTREDRNREDKPARDGGTDERDYDLEGAFSEYVESTAYPDRPVQWRRPEEDPGVPPLPETPKLGGQGASSTEELPKPMKLRPHGS